MYRQFNGLHVILNCTYQDYELGKILKSSVNELFEFVKGNIESYHSRVEIRLPYNICHCYKWLDNVNGYVPEYRPFNYYHYYHRDCLKYWEKIILIQNYGIAKQINCTFCKSVVRKVYDNVYDCEWKFDGSGVKLSSDARIEIIDLEESEEIEETDVSNFKER